MEGIKYDDKFLLLLWDKMRYFKSHYVYPSQETLLVWLREQGGLGICIRTLNRYLRELQNRQIVGRIRRVRRDPHKGLKFATTLYSIGWLGLIHLRQVGVITWKELREYLKKYEPFKARMPKKEKKGISPGDPGFYKDFTTYGSPLQEHG